MDVLLSIFTALAALIGVVFYLRTKSSQANRIGKRQRTPDRWYKAEFWETRQLDANVDETRIVCVDDGRSVIEVSYAVSRGKVQAMFKLTLRDGNSCEQYEFRGSCKRGSRFVCGPLKLHCEEPFHRWRVTFNGPVRAGGDKVHVRCNLAWRTYTLPVELNDADVTCPESDVLYHVWGSMDGWLELNRFDTQSKQWTQRALKIAGYRGFNVRRVVHNDLRPLAETEESNSEVFMRLEDGKCVYLAKRSQCYLFLANGYVRALRANKSTRDGVIHSAELQADYVAFRVKALQTFDYESDYSSKLIELVTDSNVKGWALEQYNFSKNDSKWQDATYFGSPVEASSKLQRVQLDRMVVDFHDPSALFEQYVGGKCSPLAAIVQQNKNTSDVPFEVPAGFCLTTLAFDQHVSANQSIQSQLSALRQLLSDNSTTSIESQCERVMEAFGSSGLAPELEQLIDQHLTKLNCDTFAVRSSAVGEDSDAASGAGQMETILGIRGKHDVFEAIKKCWASMYAHRAVEYRRQNGLDIFPKMAVIVQEMKHADVAGVTFTVDPIDGNPFKLIINAAYGLGEAVVAGTHAVDTIEFIRSAFCEKATEDDQQESVEVREIVTAQKNQQISVKADGSGVDVVDILEEGKKSACCLSEAQCLRLAKAALFLEKHFGSPRDVEWAIVDDKISILQARPVTTWQYVPMTEEDFLHEFDSSVSNDYQPITTANIQEMMPGPLTPLNRAYMLRSLSTMFSRLYWLDGLAQDGSPRYNLIDFPTFSYHGFFNLNKVSISLKPNRVVGEKHNVEIYLFGKEVKEWKIEEVWDFNGSGAPFPKAFVGTVVSLWNKYTYMKRVVKYEETLKNTRLDTADDPLDCYLALAKLNSFYDETMMAMLMSLGLSLVNVDMLVQKLLKGSKQLSNEVAADIAILLSKCSDVISADVPLLTKQIVDAIRDDGFAESFAQMNTGDCLKWLQTKGTAANSAFENILNNHGHRCIREGELYERPWRDDPAKLVRMVHEVVRAQLSPKRSGPESQTIESFDSSDLDGLLDKLNTKLSSGDRRFMRWMIPKARRGMATRERYKNVMVHAVDVFKRGFWHLASLLVRDKRLPNTDLLFFMTLEELDSFVRKLDTHGSPTTLINKAKRRQKIFNKAFELQFAEMSHGIPQALQETSHEASNGDRIFGMPVCRGRVKGRVCVLKSLAEASTIENGDILVVRFTDIGWTPLFPSISGLVTELGGLLSHGATIAREYGLPCIVNCPAATSAFKTGDIAILDSVQGFIQKIE